MEQTEDCTEVQPVGIDRVTSLERVAEDQAAMTIEFLRARLLAERSASTAAHQQAQQLAKKVSELEHRVESEIHMRKKLEAARSEVLFQHKGEVMEEYSHPFTDTFERRFDEFFTQQKSHACHEGNLEDSENSDLTREFEENMSNKGMHSVNGDGEVDVMDQVAREKGSLAWASHKGNKQLQIKEWAQSPRRFNRSYFSTSSPDSESPRKQWVGRSVRQIRTRAINLDLEGDGEIKQGQTNNDPEQSADEEVEQLLEHQSELIEQFKAETTEQKAWEKKFREQNGAMDDVSKIKDSFSDARDEVFIASSEQDIKKEGEFMYGMVEVAGKVNDVSKEHADATGGEMLESSHDTITGLTSVASEIHEDHNVDNAVSEEISRGGIDNGESKNVTRNCSTAMTCKTEVQEVGHNSGKEANVFYEKTPEQNLSVGPRGDFEEGIQNQIDLQRQAYTEGAKPMSSSSKFYAYSVSSSQGSNSALESALYQRQDNSSASANIQEGSEAMFRSPSEITFRSRDYISESFVRSPSNTSDSYKPFKKDSYEDNARRFVLGSPSNDNSSHGSSKGLMNSSWEEIFQRRIKAQEATKDKSNIQSGLPHPPSFEKKYMHAQSFNPSTTPLHTYGSSYVYDAYEDWKRDARIHQKSMDAGLARVMDVLRALEVAKHQLESSDDDAMNGFGYAQQLMSDENGACLTSRPVTQRELFMYDIEDKHTATRSGYVQSPSRQPVSMQQAWFRGEPITRQYTRLYARNHAYHPYAGQYHR